MQSDAEFIPEDDVVPTDESGEVSPQDMIKTLREKLNVALKEKQEYLDGWQRARADFTNFKKEEALANAQKEERIKAELAESLIPTLDSFDMAFKDATFMKADTNIITGMQALYSGLLKSLERIGIVRSWPVGEPFSPHEHEALKEVSTEKEELDHTVESVFAAGYKIGDRIIRPAQVAVWSHTS